MPAPIASIRTPPTCLPTWMKSVCAGELTAMPGILVHGDNHFIVRGPHPDRETARALVRHWSVIRIGSGDAAGTPGVAISTKEFRENLEWAIVVPGDGEMSPAVAQLLAELSARGIPIEGE